MPGSVFPPASATLSGDLRTISRYLNNPTIVQRDLRTLMNKNFVGDRILKGRVTAEGGMVEYEISESIYPGGVPEDIAPMGEFPLVGLGDPSAVLESVGKNGYRTRITLESVKRRKAEPVVKARRKLANGVVLSFDGKVMAKINAAKGSMLTLSGSSWSSGGTILRQLLTAKAMIDDTLEGYKADAVLLDNMKWAILASDKDLQAAMKRETVDTPVYTGEMLTIAGLEILAAPTGTTGASDPIVYDSTQLGSIVQEDFGQGPDAQGVIGEVEYHGAASEASDGAEYWTMAAKRQALAIIQEPRCAVVITGT